MPGTRDLKSEWPGSILIPSCTLGSEWMKAARDASPGSGRLLLALPALGATILLSVLGTGSFFKRESKRTAEGRRGDVKQNNTKIQKTDLVQYFIIESR